MEESLESHLECQICLSLICEPITISCGHSFCRVCLVHSLRRSKKQCVICRSICNINPIEASENIMLKNIALSLNPTLYNTKLREVAIEKASWDTILPVFFYNVTMFPGEILSLHLFEPRYKLMMQRISTSSRKFAYLYVSPNRPLTESVALIAQVREVEFFSDGRCLVEALLTFPRYTIQEIYEESGTQGLYLAHLKPFNDELFLTNDQPSTSSTSISSPVSISQSTSSTTIISAAAPPLSPLPLPPPSITSTSNSDVSNEKNTNTTESSPPPPPESPTSSQSQSQSQILINYKTSILQKLSDCISISSQLEHTLYNARAYDPIPSLPSLELDNQKFCSSIEFFTLVLMGRCPANCPGEKIQFLRSKNTLERLENCCRYFHVGHVNQSTNGLTGLLRQSVGGILEWMVHRSRDVDNQGNYDVDQEQNDQQDDNNDNEDDNDDNDQHHEEIHYG
mmetsp:Transcript_13535/g.14061  ORF Transcript_13535/g.14061 Transcript_13535/m.14061 type:complete len:454 (+) Transcript_13535:67-1428(+)